MVSLRKREEAKVTRAGECTSSTENKAIPGQLVSQRPPEPRDPQIPEAQGQVFGLEAEMLVRMPTANSTVPGFDS